MSEEQNEIQEEMLEAMSAAITVITAAMSNALNVFYKKMIYVAAGFLLVGCVAGYFISGMIVDNAVNQVQVAMVGYDVETTNEDGETQTEHISGAAEVLAARMLDNVGRRIDYGVRGATSSAWSMFSSAKSKEKRLGVSLNSFAKEAFGIYNPYYEGLTDDFGEDLHWIRIKPAPPVRKPAPADGIEEEPAAADKPAGKKNIWER
jgi:hypothetical protein